MCREIARHGGRVTYHAWNADAVARKSWNQHNERKIDIDPELHGRVAGGLRKGSSPEQVAGRLCCERSRGRRPCI
jgi:IS30 family transposase